VLDLEQDGRVEQLTAACYSGYRRVFGEKDMLTRSLFDRGKRVAEQAQRMGGAPQETSSARFEAVHQRPKQRTTHNSKDVQSQFIARENTVQALAYAAEGNEWECFELLPPGTSPARPGDPSRRGVVIRRVRAGAKLRDLINKHFTALNPYSSSVALRKRESYLTARDDDRIYKQLQLSTASTHLRKPSTGSVPPHVLPKLGVVDAADCKKWLELDVIMEKTVEFTMTSRTESRVGTYIRFGRSRNSFGEVVGFISAIDAAGNLETFVCLSILDPLADPECLGTIKRDPTTGCCMYRRSTSTSWNDFTIVNVTEVVAVEHFVHDCKPECFVTGTDGAVSVSHRREHNVYIRWDSN
jgi:hypothetical protein